MPPFPIPECRGQNKASAQIPRRFPDMLTWLLHKFTPCFCAFYLGFALVPSKGPAFQPQRPGRGKVTAPLP